jgi:hypothetical protein
VYSSPLTRLGSLSLTWPSVLEGESTGAFRGSRRRHHVSKEGLLRLGVVRGEELGVLPTLVFGEEPQSVSHPFHRTAPPSRDCNDASSPRSKHADDTA